MELSKDLIFISAQPDELYFHWQVELYLHNFYKKGIPKEQCFAIFSIKGEPSEYLINLKKMNPGIYWYEDERSELIDYISSVRPHILKKFFKQFPEKGKSVFYHDSDIIFRKLPAFRELLNDDVCYLSDAVNYIGYDYIMSCCERYKAIYPELSETDILDKMAACANIPTSVIKENQQGSGGAQYLLKGINADYWQQVEDDSIHLYKLLLDYEQQYPIEKHIQKWTADMWAVLWNVWKLDKQTKVVKDLSFSWATFKCDDSENSYYAHNILHLAGVTAEFGEENPDYFNKCLYRDENIIESLRKDSKAFSFVNTNNATGKYIENAIDYVNEKYHAKNNNLDSVKMKTKMVPKKKIKNAILSLNIMSWKTYENFANVGELQDKPYEEIWKYYPKVATPFKNKKMVKETPIIESYLLFHYLAKQNISPRFWYNNPLFIFNDDLYRIVGKDVVKVDLDGLYYFAFRETFSHPFFSILEQLLAKNGGKLCKPNKATMRNTGCMNKMYAFNELYAYRQTYIQDIVIPYNLQAVNYPVFIQFLVDNLGSKLVFKNDCIQEGRGVIFKDLKKHRNIPELNQAMDLHKVDNKALLVTPAYAIKNEYRCYFTNFTKAKIFSIKQRLNTTAEKDFYAKPNIHINKNIEVDWLEVKTNSTTFEFASSIAYDMIKLMSYDTGCIEFIMTEDDRIVFLEVNQMSGPLPFEGEDCDNINDYYLSMIDGMIGDGDTDIE